MMEKIEYNVPNDIKPICLAIENDRYYKTSFKSLVDGRCAPERELIYDINIALKYIDEILSKETYYPSFDSMYRKALEFYRHKEIEKVAFNIIHNMLVEEADSHPEYTKIGDELNRIIYELLDGISKINNWQSEVCPFVLMKELKKKVDAKALRIFYES